MKFEKKTRHVFSRYDWWIAALSAVTQFRSCDGRCNMRSSLESRLHSTFSNTAEVSKLSESRSQSQQTGQLQTSWRMLLLNEVWECYVIFPSKPYFMPNQESAWLIMTLHRLVIVSLRFTGSQPCTQSSFEIPLTISKNVSVNCVRLM